MTNSLRKVLITGSKGQLGLALAQHPLAAVFQLTCCSHAELDITDKTALQRAIQQYQPDVIINTAAYTAVDKAEHEQALALQINHTGAQQLASTCAEYHLPLLHLSTDYIFAGNANKPYTETDVAQPLNHYGRSKWLGEEAIRAHHAQHIILRVSGIFSEHGNNFVKSIVRLANEKTELRIVADQISSPTAAQSIAEALWTILSQRLHYGTYHFCSHEPVSWHAFASEVIHTAKKFAPLAVTHIHAITAAEYAAPAKRPAYSALDSTKIQRMYGIQSPCWRTDMQAVIQRLYQGEIA